MSPDPIPLHIHKGVVAGNTMVPKKSVHIRNENLEIWESLPSPSEFVNTHLTNLGNSRPQGDEELRISKMRAKLEQANAEVEMFHQRITEKEKERQEIEEEIESALAASNFKIDRNEFISTTFSEAEIACRLGREFGNVRTNTHFRFHSVEDGKIYITNLMTNRRPGFKQGVVSNAVERLELGQGKVKLGGGLIPVKWQEEALIALHPHLWVVGEWITYIPDFEFEDTHAAIVHCKRCGKNDFNKIYGPQHDPYEEPDYVDFCTECGFLTRLGHDFPDAGEDYADWAEDIAFETHRERERGI